MKDELIEQHQAEKPEHLDMERRQAEEQELTAEQEDFMLEVGMERERRLKNPTSFELTIQKLRERKEKEGWTSKKYFDEIEKKASYELDEFKRDLELSYGVD